MYIIGLNVPPSGVCCNVCYFFNFGFIRSSLQYLLLAKLCLIRRSLQCLLLAEFCPNQIIVMFDIG